MQENNKIIFKRQRNQNKKIFKFSKENNNNGKVDKNWKTKESPKKLVERKKYINK